MAGRWPVVGLKTSPSEIAFSVKKKDVGKFKWLEVSDFEVSVSAKPTKDSSVKEMKAGTSLNGGGGVAVSAKNTNSANHALQHKFAEAPIFIAGELAGSGDEGSGSFTFGYAGKNFRPSVKIDIISLDAGESDEVVSVGFAETSLSFPYTGIWKADNGGLNWQFTAQVSFKIGPDKGWILKALGERLAKRAAMKGLGKGFGLSFSFIEGGYLTLEAAVKNVIAGKGVWNTANNIEYFALKVSEEFMRGATGGPPIGIGGPIGRKWFENALDYTRKVHPKITFTEFQQVLNSPEADKWRRQARAQVRYNVRLALLQIFEENPPYWADGAVIKRLRGVLRLDEKSERLPITPLKVRVIDNTVQFPDDHAGRNQVPPLVRRQVRNRVRNNLKSGTCPYKGITYHYQYNRATNCIEVRGGDRASVVPFDGYHG